MKNGRILVLGHGVAGLTAARLLVERGRPVDCLPTPQARGPVIVIGQPTAALLLELWQADLGLFDGAHRLRGRVILWERPSAPAPLPAPAIAIHVDRLRERLVERGRAVGLRIVAAAEVDPGDYDWVVRAGGRDSLSEGSIAFGCRRGAVAAIKLTPRAHTDRTVMESVPGGWLFLIPVALGRGVLQAVFAGPPGPLPDALPTLLEQSQAVSRLVEEIVDHPTGFAAQPCLAGMPCTSGSIAVGDAAMTLDPMSGNGIGNGLRSAILAAAVIEAAGRETAPQGCFDHYGQRLQAAMRSHVQTCVDFYRRAAHAAGWQGEIDAMNAALDRLPSRPDEFPFMLNNGRLDRAPQQGWV